MKVYCSKCDTWRSEGAYHCAACHRSFSGLGSFDSHNRGPDANCDVSGDKWRQTKAGLWTDQPMWDPSGVWARTVGRGE